MQMWKLTLAYDGTTFHGWQVQPGLATVQGTLAGALHHLTGERVLPQGSGRTDAGVHALAQVASFALEAPIPPANLMRALNRALPAAIRVTSAEHAGEGFHARHTAVRKTYQYRIFARGGGICTPFLANYVWDCPWPVKVDRLREAAEEVVGEHDFTSFAAVDPDAAARAGGEEKSARRTIFASSWNMEAGMLVYRVTGTGFLHHMVRNLVGTFVDMACGRVGPGGIGEILEARDRSAAGPTAPARGLYLESVEYEV